MMVGDGSNRKSMSYIVNITAFLEACVKSEILCKTYSYAGTLDFHTNQLEQNVRIAKTEETSVGLLLTNWLGILLGNVGEGVSRISGNKLQIC